MVAGFHNVTHTIPSPNTNGLVRPPALLSVLVEDDEEVQWQWTHLADGRSVVTGYRIVNRTKCVSKRAMRRFYE